MENNPLECLLFLFTQYCLEVLSFNLSGKELCCHKWEKIGPDYPQNMCRIFNTTRGQRKRDKGENVFYCSIIAYSLVAEIYE
jgi:hypothetical protein